MEIKRYVPENEFVALGEVNSAISRLEDYPSGPYGGYDTYDGAEEGIHLREYLRRLRRHKWLILSLVTIVTTVVTIYAYQIKPWYTATAVLEIGKDNAVIVKSGEITLNGEQDWGDTDINTKLLSFSNPNLFIKVADELKLADDPRIIENLNKKSLFSFLRPSTAEAQAIKEKQTQDPAARQVLVGGYVQRAFAVEQIKNTRAIKISFTDENPETAEKVANAVAKTFRETSFDSQTEKFTNSVDWLDKSTRELKAQAQAAEEALTDYGRNNEIFATGGEDGKATSTLTTSNLSQLNDQFMRAQTERILKKSLYEQVQAGRVQDLPEAFSDPKIAALQQQIGKLEVQLAELKVNYGPQNPKVMEIQNQIPVLSKQLESGRKSLEAKLRAEYERADQNATTLNAALNRAKAAAVNENQASIKLNILKQDVDTARTLYTDFLKNTNEAKTRAAEQNNKIKFIQEAQRPGAPVGPNRLTLILAGFVLSLGAGIGLALFLEYLDNTIKSQDDVEKYAMLPTLGVIPAMSAVQNAKKSLKKKIKRKQIAESDDGSQLGLETRTNMVQADLMLNLDSHSITGEAYRALRTSLLLSTADTPPKVILVTSGQSGEGKTTTALNTAISLTQLGARVLIIDCDLRRPTIHKRLDVSHVNGLSNYLAMSCEIESVIQELSIQNLSVIPSGPIPPNPAELLSSRKMRDMLDLLRRSYDHIILDSPPVVNVTDPIILSTIADGTIFVIRSGSTTREMVKRSRQELLNVKSKIFGVVLNNVNIHKDGYDYYSYHRYTSYDKFTDAAD